MKRITFLIVSFLAVALSLSRGQQASTAAGFKAKISGSSREGRRRTFAALLAAMTCVLMTAAAWNEPGDLAWEGEFDLGDFAQAFAVATLKDQVFVSGLVRNAPFPDQPDFLIRAYDARTGGLLWHDQVGNGFGLDEFAVDVVTDEKRVFVSGTAFIPGRSYDWLVRAYDAKTGRLLWEDLFDFAENFDQPLNGTLAVGNGLVFVGGFATKDVLGNNDWIVRAYDASSGVPVWQDQFDFGGIGGPGIQDAVASLAVKGGRLFAGGWGSTATSLDILVRAYDARTGTLLWQHNTPGDLGVGVTTARRVRAQDGHVFVGSVLETSPLKFHFLIQAYDAKTGSLHWQDQVGPEGQPFLEDIDAHDGRVFAAGDAGPGCRFEPSPPSNCDTFIRSYNAATGTLLWERKFDLSGFDDFARQMTATKGTVFVSSVAAATFLSGMLTGEWRVQALDSSTGRLRWERAGNKTKFEDPIGMAASHQGRLFVVGRSVEIIGPNTLDVDFIVRAYEARGRRSDDDDAKVNEVDREVR